MGMLLYEHNRAAYEAACRLMQRDGKAAVIHPTGTGKSFIAFQLCAEHPQQTICWLSPSEYIFHTQQENWLRSGGSRCSNIRFLTYAKLMLMEEDELRKIEPDYIVLDEFHRCGAAMWGRGVTRLLAFFPKNPLLGLYATNIRYLDNQRDMADELFDGKIASQMTLGEAIVRGILSPPKYVLSVFSYQKNLKQYEARVRNARSQAVRAAAQQELEALRRALAQAEGLDQIFDRYMTERTGKYLVFCADYDHMQEMIAKSGEWFAKVDKEPHVYSVYSEEPDTSKEFADFKADASRHLKLLFCIDMLNEGIHVENISGVILLRPTVSPIIYKQQIGRALSAGKKKNAVIFDVVQNVENLCSIGTVEEEMRAAVEAYRRQGREAEIVNDQFYVMDETCDCIRLFQQLEGTLSASWDLMYAAAERYYREKGSLEIPKRYVTPEGLSLGQWLNTQRKVYHCKTSGILTQTQVERLEAIGMRWRDAREAAWEKYYTEAKRYYQQHGNLLVPAREEVNGMALGRWITQLRTARKSGLRDVKEDGRNDSDENAVYCLPESDCMILPATGLTLTQEKIDALDGIGMVWDVPAYLWEQNFKAAEAYYRAFGNLNVPSGYVNADGVRLGSWIHKMRMLGPCTTKQKPETRQGLAAQPKQEKLETRQGLAAQPKQEKLELKPSSKSYRGTALTAEQTERLNQIGMIWQPKRSAAWDGVYALACAYYQRHGNLNVPVSYITDNGAYLGKWIRRQREAYKNGALQTERKKKLDQIGMIWQPDRARYVWSVEKKQTANSSLRLK